MQKQSSKNIVFSTLDKLAKWSQRSSLWPLYLDLGCCGVEIMATVSQFNLDCLGTGIFCGSPRHADVLIVSGTVTLKMATRVRRLYDQMAEPKYVIAVGGCAISGGPYWQHGYHVLKGVDQILPVDVYVPGCPPIPEAMIEGIIALQEKIQVKLK